MTSRFETPSIHLTQFERTRERLSDDVIAHVLPRGWPSRGIVDSGVALTTPLHVAARSSTVSQQTYTAHDQLPDSRTSTMTRSPVLERTSMLTFGDKLVGGTARAAYNGNPNNIFKLARDTPSSLLYQTSGPTSALAATPAVRNVRKQNDEERAKTLEIKKIIRREQCRANQARYRSRQRSHQRHLQQTVQRLHEEVQGIKIKRERLRYSEKSNRSPWTIVSEVFQLLQTSFRSPWHMNEMKRHAGTRQSLRVLQKSFTHDVAMGELSGVKALLEQLRRCSLYFGDPQLHLQHVEEVVPGVLTASARLGVTVSEFTLQCVFPHLNEAKEGETEDEDEDEEGRQLLREKLIGQRLDCSCKITFLTDEDTGRVVRLETSVDWMGALCRLLHDASVVASVLSQALLSADGAVGDLTDHPGCERDADTL
ncbi:hypothetical protein PRIC2_001402 [Phytophthora ramorum]